ncbi:MAG: hypothetical protein HY695_01820 [Deltaproteobacteria bacterium]|nr:hypothetical protein [Deltaproteobacteria bacterium]
MNSPSLEIQGGLRWYAIQTKPAKEAVVEKRLRDLALEVFLPWVRLRRRVGTRYQWVLAPLFPGYLFCRLDILAAGKSVRYAPGVKDFVKFGNAIADLGVDVIQTLKERCPGGIARIQSRNFKPGEPVLIREGPLSGLEAVFEQELKESERVAVLLEFLGRRTRLVLGSEMIRQA